MFRAAIATVSIVAVAAASALMSAHARTQTDNRAAAPVVVELFTSEGCSSCPPADALLQQLNERRGTAPVIALGEHVDYWDHQGWKDRFSSTLLTHRQEIYAARFGNESIYTPQMVVDGRTEFVGSDAAAARRAIDRAASAPHGAVRIDVTRGPVPGRATISVSASALPDNHQHADVLVAITEDHLSSDVKRGENHGRVLAHTAVVRELLTIGDTPGADTLARADVTIDPSWKPADLMVVAFVQERRSRAILAAGAVPLVRP